MAGPNCGTPTLLLRPLHQTACSYRKSCMVPGSPLCFLIEPHTERKHNTDFSLEPGPPGAPGCRLPIWGFWAPVYMWLTWPYADHSLNSRVGTEQSLGEQAGKLERRDFSFCVSHNLQVDLEQAPPLFVPQSLSLSVSVSLSLICKTEGLESTPAKLPSALTLSAVI